MWYSQLCKSYKTQSSTVLRPHSCMSGAITSMCVYDKIPICQQGCNLDTVNESPFRSKFKTGLLVSSVLCMLASLKEEYFNINLIPHKQEF